MKRALPLLLALPLAGSALAVDPIRMDLRNTFGGTFDDSSAIDVLLENDGPDAQGILRVSSEMGETAYPVELPQGARKRLLTLPKVTWGEIRYSLQTDRGSLLRTTNASYASESAPAVLLLGDDSGALAFIRQSREGQRSVTRRDAYVVPENAPARPIAYRAFSAIVLGPGAERMGDGVVTALKDYALGGGTLVFVGGASAPVLDDRRWVGALPGSGYRPRTISGSRVLGKAAGTPLSGAFTVLAPTRVVPGATQTNEGGIPIESEIGFGTGRVVVLGYSPFESPLSAWSGRGRAMTRFVRGTDLNRARNFRAPFSQETANNPTYATAVYSGVTRPPGYPGSPPDGPVADPFSTQLPPSGTVFGILAGYFVLVVPVSFLALRKLKRGELAWVTAPVLSLGFAGMLFRSAQGLYSAELSTASQGILIAQQGAPEAMFYGKSQMFFPRGGVYDLKLDGVDSLNPAATDNGYGYGAMDRNSLAGFNPIDVGEVEAPRLEANNLAFREAGYVQRIEAGDWFHIRRTDVDHVTVENRSPYAFNGSLVNGRMTGKGFDLAPGARKTLETGVGDGVPMDAALGNMDPRLFTRREGRIALFGTIKGFRPGPQLGKEVSERTGISVLAFAQDTLKEPVR